MPTEDVGVQLAVTEHTPTKIPWYRATGSLQNPCPLGTCLLVGDLLLL